MPDIFLSYSREDLARAKHFAQGFEREGFTVWWDQALDTGEAFDRVTEKALEEARAVVVLWSTHSVESRWVRAEATQADESRKLVPVTIEPCKRPIMFHLTQTADLSHWNGDPADTSWQALVAGLRRLLGKAVLDTALVSAAAGPARKTRGVAIGIGALVLAGMIVAGVYFMHGRGPGRPAAPPAASVAQAGPVSLAVLPFANLSADPQQEYFSDGLTEEILNELAQVPDLRLIGRTSSFSFKGRNEDLRVIGQKLGVANLLEGSIRKEGQQLRITAQLINAGDGSHRWSKTYERELKGVFALQEEVARDVAQALSITLDVGRMSRAKGGTTNVAAFDTYLLARGLWRQSEFKPAVQKFREALALDPDFRAAWVGLNSAYIGMLPGYPEDEAVIRAGLAEAEARIEAIAPGATETILNGSGRLMADHKWQAAETLLVSNGTPKADGFPLGLTYGSMLRSVGRVQDAVPFYLQATLVEPLSLVVSGQLQIVFDSAGMREAAQKEYLRGKSLPGDYSQWDFHAQRRQWMRPGISAANREREFRAGLAVDQVAPQLAATLMRIASNREAALAAIHKAFDDPAYQNNARMLRLLIYADYYGDRQLAVAVLRRSLVELKGLTTLIPWYPSESGWRSDPGFKTFAREMGLVDYWRATGKWGDFCKPVGTDDFECH